MHTSRWMVLMGVAVVTAEVSAQPPPILPELRPADVRYTRRHHLDDPSDFAPAYGTRQEWERRAERLRVQLLVANGLWPMPPRTPLRPVIHGRIERDAYTIEKVFFASLPGHYVCGNLYRPKAIRGKVPGVLCPHGHWPNGRFFERSEAEAQKEIAAGAEKTLEGARYPLQARCAMLARMGCVVFHYDMVGYADSYARIGNQDWQIPHRAGFADAEAELRLQSFMGLQTWNSIRALDFLLSLPEVDADRIAVTGSSGGGTQTFILAAMDPRVRVSFPAVMVSMNMQGGCICENCSHLRVGTNNVEIAALVAPRPQAMTGADDWTRDIETRGLPQLKQIYRLYGAEELVNAKYFPFPHNYNQVSREMMYQWFNRHLRLGWPEPVREKPFVPVAPKELSVFDDQHPRPGDAWDAQRVRRYWTETAAEQMRHLLEDRERYCQTVAAAWKVMVHSEMPRQVQETGRVVNDRGEGYRLKLALVTRPGTGEQVPVAVVTPEQARPRGTVVWTHPQGKSSLFVEPGKLVAHARRLLEHKLAIVAPDLFFTGEAMPKDKPKLFPAQAYHKDIPFAGYVYGYNRSILAERVHDLLTVIRYAEQLQHGSVYLVAFGDAGAWALPARALAGDDVALAVIDLAGFDFAQVREVYDTRMVPGALKYGGVAGLLPLCRQTVLVDAPELAAEYVRAAPAVRIERRRLEPMHLVELVLQQMG